MASSETERSNPIGTILLGFVAGALAFAAAYLWLTDSGDHALSLPSLPALSLPSLPSLPVWRHSEPSPAAVQPPAAAVIAPPPAATVVRAPIRPPLVVRPAPAPAATVTQPGPVDPQVADDAAAVGMTARTRPSDNAGAPTQ